MGENKHQSVSTVLSAVVYEPGRSGGKVLVKESDRGLSLLGSDRIDWSLGAVNGLVTRVSEQHDGLLHLHGINGIYSGISPSGKFVAANICFRASVSLPFVDNSVRWVNREEILSEKYPINTPDLLEALRDLDTPMRAALDFVNEPAINDFGNFEGEAGDEEATVCSTVVYNPFIKKLLFVIRKDGCYSNPGGKVESSDFLGETFRENREETGREWRGSLRGLIGAITKRTPSGRYVTSFPVLAITYDADLVDSSFAVQSGEIIGGEWIGIDDLDRIERNKFYTLDTPIAARIGMRKYSQGSQLIPLDILRTVVVDD